MNVLPFVFVREGLVSPLSTWLLLVEPIPLLDLVLGLRLGVDFAAGALLDPVPTLAAVLRLSLRLKVYAIPRSILLPHPVTGGRSETRGGQRYRYESNPNQGSQSFHKISSCFRYKVSVRDRQFRLRAFRVQFAEI